EAPRRSGNREGGGRDGDRAAGISARCTFADAILDRLVHNSYRLELEGQRSIREGETDSEAPTPIRAGRVKWQVSKGSPEMSALLRLPPAPVGQQAPPVRAVRLTRSGPPRRARGPSY